ncbi:tRNA epoxyqueuosine(34) reductase QueG [Neptunicoccus cionae]|uniref:tRNA epoxyqueuosine(34) reductase QueG n=1 Tax=Neptunicoccus cionae TaxID=2035344 RepID=UPI000C79311B|nr:tRNA epoxyqueuosine(34) reductase QueG [Amylibacter cionae]PLS22720.1 tRNA epoxyqueuosine(34) reductase QueG [Amylibacter cionae]
MSAELTRALRDKALAEGFSDFGICRPDAAPHTAQRLAEFVGDGRHGQMGWMAERMNWRGSAAALWPEARSVIMLAENYGPDHDPLEALAHKDRAAISVYAQNKDYHDVVKKRLKRVGRWLIEQADGAEIKVFVDTAPVMEKPLAMAAGLGWQGKHTNVVSRRLGSWFFLGAIFTTLELEETNGEVDHCGSCRKCLDICPTDAFPAPYQLDARRCISYLTIEHRGPVDVALRKGLGNRIYGCDDCLAVCPWNKFASRAAEIKYHGRAELQSPRLGELAVLDETEFRALFSGSPIKRIGRNGFVRNVLYAIGNSEDAGLLSVVQALCEDEDETVADAARWACGELVQTVKD